MQAENNNTCPDDQTLHHVCLGDAPVTQVEEVLAHIDQCPSCPARIDALWQKAYQHISTAENGALPRGHQPALATHPSTLASLLARTGANLDLGFLKPSPHSNMLGRLGPYDLVRVIGSGGYGIVFEANDSRTRQSVAVKCLRPGKLASPGLRERFLREAATPGSIAHPGVPAILDQGVDGDLPYLVMPLLSGFDFQTLIRQQAPVPIQDSIRYLKQICEILQAAHARGIIHRDIKPSNLWLEKSASGEDRVLLLDFGLATLDQDSNHITLTGDLIGTPAYFSPEQAEGFSKGISPSTDLFSLGTVAYEMLTGKRAFPGLTPLEILRNMAHFKFAQPKELRPEIPQRLNDLIMDLLAWYPSHRPASAALVLERLNHPKLLVEPLLHRRKWLQYTAGGLATLATSALAYRWYSRRNQATQLGTAPLLKPDNIFPLPGAITFDFNKLGDFYTEPNEVYWANAEGGFGNFSLTNRQATQVGRFDIRPVDLRAGIRNLVVADAEGRLQLAEMKSAKTTPVIPSPFDKNSPPNSPVHMLWSGNAGRYLVARANQVFLLQLTGGTWSVVPYPQDFGAGTHITSLIHYPQGTDSLRPFAATMANGWIVNFGFPAVQAYDKRLATEGVDYRMASDTSGNLLATWSADGFLRISSRIANLESAKPYRIPRQINDLGEFKPIQPVNLQFARQKDLIALHGMGEGKGIVALFSRKSNHAVAKLDVDDPVEMEIRGTDLWVLDSQGSLNQFHQFEKHFG